MASCAICGSRMKSPEAIASQLNRSIAAIMTRAARLGLPRRTAPGRKPGRRMDGQERAAQIETRINQRITPPRTHDNINVTPATSLRICLMCLNKFESFGRHNRICATCKNSSEYESASSLSEIHLPSS